MAHRSGLGRVARLCIAALLLVAGPAAAQQAVTPAVTAYTHAGLIDGRSDTVIPDVTVVVEGERILAIGPAATTPVPAGAKVTDLRGRFVLPGLIDAHVHVGDVGNRPASLAQLTRMLYGGITAVRDMAGDTRILGEVARSALLGQIPSPDIHYSALMAGPSFFSDPRTHAAAQGTTPGGVPWMQAVTAETDLVTAVAMARGTGATGIKLYADIDAGLVSRITAEAARQGIPVWSHAALFPAGPFETTRAGVGSISHAYMLAYSLADLGRTTSRDRPPLASLHVETDTTVLPRLFDEMKRQGTILDATVYTMIQSDSSRPAGRPARGPLGVRLTRAAHLAGVAVAAGTDFSPAPTDSYPALQTELEMLVRDVGLSPADAIRAATSVAARTFRRDQEMGTLVAGKLANFVVVARNPLADIAALRSVVLTVKRGWAYPRGDYRQPPAALLAEEY